MKDSLLVLICDDQQYKPDLILLDLMMPKMFGEEVCKEIRKNSDVPIIMLSAKDDTIDKILGLEIGADDYITKPFSPREVVTRIKTVLRRSTTSTLKEECHIKFRDLDINLDAHEVKLKGESIKITPKEMKILYMLASSPGSIFNREHILSEVWGYDYFGDTRVVDTQIKRLRKKLQRDDLSWEIRSVYGVGYKLEVL